MHKFVKHMSGRIDVFLVFVYLSSIVKENSGYMPMTVRHFAVKKFNLLGIYIMWFITSFMTRIATGSTAVQKKKISSLINIHFLYKNIIIFRHLKAMNTQESLLKLFSVTFIHLFQFKVWQKISSEITGSELNVPVCNNRTP